LGRSPRGEGRSGISGMNVARFGTITLLGRVRRKGEKERELRLLEDARGSSLDDEEGVR
jgi:hypothetical protein